VCALLLSMEAEEQDYQARQHADRDHEEHKGLVVQVIRGESRRDLQFVGHRIHIGLSCAIAELRQPACVVKHDENVVVNFVAGEEHIVTRAPLGDLLLYDALIAYEVAHFGLQVLDPERACLDIAIVVFFACKDEDVEAVSRQQPVLRRGLLALNLD